MRTFKMLLIVIKIHKIMKATTFIFFCMILCASIKMNYAQAPDWSRVLSTSPYEAQEGRVVAADDNQNVYMAAAISGPVTFDGTVYSSIGKRDLLITKMGKSGTTLWKKQFNASVGGILLPQAINVDKKLNIYLLCSFSGTVKIGNNTLVSDADHNAFIAKFNSSGSGVWATSYKYAGTGISKIALDGNNNSNVFVTSFSTELIKFSSSGAKLWAQNYPDRTLQAIVISNNVLYLCGALQQGITTFGSIALSSVGVAANTGFIIKGDLNGNFNKSFIINDGVMDLGSTSVSDMVINKKGDLLITGGYRKDLILGYVVIQNPDYGYYTYIAKCDKNFNFAWARTSSVFSINNLDIINYRIFSDNSGLIYEYGTHQFPFSYGAVTFNPEGGNQYLFKFDSKGNALAVYALLNSSRFGTIVTPASKILSTGSYTYDGATSYGNLYITQRNNYLSIDWRKISSNNQSGFLSANGIKHDSDGNMYVLSAMRGYCNYFGIVIRNDNFTTLLAKHDPEGNVLWVKEINDATGILYGYTVIGSRITLDKANNIIIFGRFDNNLIIGDQTVLTSQTSWSTDGYVAKFDPNGQFQWAVKFDVDNSFGNNCGVTTDTENNIIATGEFANTMTVGGNTLSSDGLDGAFMVKLAPDGNCLWAKGFPIGEIVYLAMAGTDGSNNIYFTGEMYNRTSKQLKFGDLIVPQSDEDCGNVVVKFDPNGNAVWGNFYGKVTGLFMTESCWPVAIKTDTEGNTYSWGWCYNNAIFGSYTLSSPFNGGPWNFYLAKINSSGEVLWANGIAVKNYVVTYGELFDMDPEGNLYVGAQFKDSIRIDETFYKPQSANDFLLAKYSNDGTFQWLKTVPSNGNFGNSLSIFDEDVLTIAGTSINDIPFNGQVFIGNGGTSGILATLGNMPVLSPFRASDGITKSDESLGDILDVQVYPNPSNGQFTLKVKSETNGKMVVSVYNLLGKTVKKLNFNINSNETLEKIDILFLPKGTYALECKLNGNKIIRQVVVE